MCGLTPDYPVSYYSLHTLSSTGLANDFTIISSARTGRVKKKTKMAYHVIQLPRWKNIKSKLFSSPLARRCKSFLFYSPTSPGLSRAPAFGPASWPTLPVCVPFPLSFCMWSLIVPPSFFLVQSPSNLQCLFCFIAGGLCVCFNSKISTDTGW